MKSTGFRKSNFSPKILVLINKISPPFLIYLIIHFFVSVEQPRNQSNEVINIGKDMPDEPYSMLSEIERELHLRFQAHDNLPGKSFTIS